MGLFPCLARMNPGRWNSYGGPLEIWRESVWSRGIAVVFD